LKRFSQLLLVLALLATVLAACTSVNQSPTAGPITLTDGLGREVTLAAPAQRIVSMAPSNTEILYAVSAGDQVVGRDEFSNFPEAAAAVQSIGGSMGDYNFEQIVSLKPDLVLAAEINTPEQVKALEDLGLTVYYLKNPLDMEGMYTNLQIVGQLTGQTPEATALVDSLKQRVVAAQAKVANVDAKPKVFYELDGTDAAKPWTSGSGTFIDQLITMAGGENVAASLDGAWGQISQEALLVANPEIILLGDAAYGTTAEQVSARAGWEAIQAVQTGQIVPFNDDTVSRPGPRLVDALEELVRILHPELK
jgi:iron complex transport system substrate-binding protein